MNIPYQVNKARRTWTPIVKSTAVVLAAFRKGVKDIQANERITDEAKAEEIVKERAKAVEKVGGYLDRIDPLADEAAAAVKHRVHPADPTTAEGEHKHARIWRRIEAQRANGADPLTLINQAHERGDRDMLAVLYTELPHYWPDEAKDYQEMIAGFDRALMSDDEREIAEAGDEIAAAAYNIRMSVNHALEEFNGGGVCPALVDYDGSIIDTDPYGK